MEDWALLWGLIGVALGVTALSWAVIAGGKLNELTKRLEALENPGGDEPAASE